jgi:hypothetical protein
MQEDTDVELILTMVEDVRLSVARDTEVSYGRPSEPVPFLPEELLGRSRGICKNPWAG